MESLDSRFRNPEMVGQPIGEGAGQCLHRAVELNVGHLRQAHEGN
jgi:hypothetical protein